MMKKVIRCATPVALASVIASCQTATMAAQNAVAIVPQPEEIAILDETANPPFTFAAQTTVKATPKEAEFAAKELKKWMKALNPDKAPAAQDTAINFITAENKLGDEAYQLTVNAKEITIKASAAPGFYYGAQTLRRLLPASHDGLINGAAKIPALTINDAPRYKWRGMMLDCCRHWWPMDEIKKIIDMMASLKLNIFHWHLTEDQAWRIEIKKYPELVEKGAWRSGVGFDLPTTSTTHYREDGMYGGFYTQEDAKEIIDYCAQRNITVVPEIEVPGHAMAMLHVFPQYGCTGGPYEIMQKGGVFPSIACAGNEQAMKFYEDVFDEIAALFPSKYIHIGGDEAPKDEWKKCPKCQARMKEVGAENENQLQNWVTERMEKHLAKLGKRIIGWDEILEGDKLSSSAVVQCWRTWTKPQNKAAENGNEMVFSPTANCYLDYKQSDTTKEPRSIGTVTLPLEQVYKLDPSTSLTQEQEKLVKGCQGNVWCEYIAGEDHLEYMIAPRIAAIAEAAWTQKKNRGWQDFRRRLENEVKFFKAQNFKYRELDPIEEPKSK
ncbi:MAG: beta-N-acetylhexosaminidase [Candidatus Sumerlaeales bacterium]|nr:beta-N-acetylhexosaminidase [Candidatus Sumerlaeales bacterium]